MDGDLTGLGAPAEPPWPAVSNAFAEWWQVGHEMTAATALTMSDKAWHDSHHPQFTPTFCHAFGVLSLLHSCSSEVKPRTPGLKGASEMMRCTSPGVDDACQTADFNCSCR